ncbi:MAG TPA: glycogen debranching N-terminal domain-containing protein [Candidatus Binatia bacterium]|nr:glycogen debranching N-terminal domain-containing protein [Candidatus Binatia bacterium]
MDDVIQVRDRFYVLATSSRVDDRTRVLKHGDTFAVFDRHGDIHGMGAGEQGLYHAGTRFLSRLELRLEDARPLLLSSTVKSDNALLAVDLTNPDVHAAGRLVLERGTLHLFRGKFLWQGCCHERLRVTNYGRAPVSVRLTVRLEADFKDVFEVRGTARARHGRRLATQVAADGLVLGYEGLDGVVRRTRVTSAPPPSAVGASELCFDLTVSPKARTTVDVMIACEPGACAALPFDAAFAADEAALAGARARGCETTTSNALFDEWLDRSLADIRMMAADTARGPYPYAGIPWYSAPFGRDGVVTALECLWVDPAFARGVLAFLADTQATETNPTQDAEPGKILHEARDGEMAALGEVPFGRYYGSVDATPLFVALAGAYYERTADLAFVETIWPHIERALAWIDRCGALDADGFVTYARRSPHGLVNQGWKDSHDAIFHADGTLAAAPIALCEVQGYVYLAKRRAAELATALGELRRGAELLLEARELQRRFLAAFWCEDLGTYALALDGARRPCRVSTSNAGQCLFSRIASPAHARRLAETLLGPEMFSGWGIRTVGTSAGRYNPMSYHNGSVWPHDTALVAWGFARYGLKEPVVRLMDGLFDASLFVDLRRMPELVCGFERRAGEGPTLYPVACTPQAWAAGAALLLLQACLGLTIRAPQREIRFDRPALPARLREVHLRGLRVGEAVTDLDITRHAEDVGVNVARKEGELEVVVVK